MSEFILNMWVYAVESGRITVNFVPAMYRENVKAILGIEE